MNFPKKIEKTLVFAWSSILMFVVILLAQYLPAVSALYGTFVTGLVGLATAFFAGHVSAQWVSSKTADRSDRPPEHGPKVEP